jgi:hypothetical protein
LLAYQQQLGLINQILQVFRDSSAGNEGHKAQEQEQEQEEKVYELMRRMQELGSPPKEVMGDLPDGLVSPSVPFTFSPCPALPWG